MITAGLIVLRTATGGRPADAPVLLLPATLFFGIVTAASCGWLLAQRIGDDFRRGLTAALGVFGALLLAILAVPADILGRVAGLAVYLTALAAAAVATVRKARRSAGI